MPANPDNPKSLRRFAFRQRDVVTGYVAVDVFVGYQGYTCAKVGTLVLKTDEGADFEQFLKMASFHDDINEEFVIEEAAP